MSSTKYDGYDPKTLGPNVHSLYDLLHNGWIDRKEFNNQIKKAEYEDEVLKGMSQYEKDNRFTI